MTFSCEEPALVTPDERILVVCDHPGPPAKLLQHLRSLSNVTFLLLPNWLDSALCRRMRLHELSQEEHQAVNERFGQLLAQLREAFGQSGISDEYWQYFRQLLEAHTITPLAEAIGLIRHHATRADVSRIVAIADVTRPEYWSGRNVAVPATDFVANELRVQRSVVWWPAWGRVVGSAVESAWGHYLRGRLFSARGKRRLAQLEKTPPTPAHLLRRADVLFLTAGPVVERLAAKIAAELDALGLSAVIACSPEPPQGKQRGDYISLPACVPAQRWAEARSQLHRCPKIAQKVCQQVHSGLGRHVDAFLCNRILSLFCQHRPLLDILSADAAELLERLQVSAVVAFHFLPRFLTPYVVRARQLSIPTVCCQHGLICGLDYEAPWFDVFVVFNQYTAELIAPSMSSHSRIEIVGNPWLEALSSATPKPTRPQTSKPVTLIATQPNEPPDAEQRSDWWFAAVTQACAEAGLYVVVKLHPQQNKERDGRRYALALHNAGSEGEIVEHGRVPLNKLICGCDLFISQFSSAIMEAIVLGKPVLAVDFRSPQPFYPFDECPTVFRVTAPEEVGDKLRLALSCRPADTRSAEFWRRHLEPFDAHATSRIAAVIASAIEQSPRKRQS